MSSWLFAIVAILACAGTLGVFLATRAFLTRRHLQKVFHGRAPEASFESCRARFPQVELRRTALAYRWVQALVPFAGLAPIEADDDLWKHLRIDQGRVGDQFESAHEWRGERPEDAVQPPVPSARTVGDLMAEVLAHGYEGYAAVLSRYANGDAPKP